ncbi:MAG: nitroreductase family protein [Candidatus Omnitrophica bacterium]|nr:nitroreductase family protein [Candidatus Omnitrophota bacterium]
MEFFDAIRGRHSVREFKQRPVSKEIVEVMVDAGRLASTARNLQPWHFVGSLDKRILIQVSELAPNAAFCKDASAIVAIFSDDTKYYLEDCCAATQNILLAAHALGLGGCWVAGDKKDYCDKIKEMFKVPKDKKLVSIVVVGHPVDNIQKTPKKHLKEMMHWEKW